MEKTCYFPQIWKQTIPGDYSHSYKCSFDYISSLKKTQRQNSAANTIIYKYWYDNRFIGTGYRHKSQILQISKIEDFIASHNFSWIYDYTYRKL